MSVDPELLAALGKSLRDLRDAPARPIPTGAIAALAYLNLLVALAAFCCWWWCCCYAAPPWAMGRLQYPQLLQQCEPCAGAPCSEAELHANVEEQQLELEVRAT